MKKDGKRIKGKVDRVMASARISATLVREAKRLAFDRGMTFQDLMEQALSRYIRNHPAAAR